jgi:L-threonylcarbamoyladenylate synthase
VTTIMDPSCPGHTPPGIILLLAVPIICADSDAIAAAARTLRSGGIVAFPTETVYGLGAIVYDSRAVARIFEAKGRPSFDPLIVHILNEAMLSEVVSSISPAARALAERFWPGPLTLVLPRGPHVPLVATAGLHTVGVRMPSHPVARALIEQTGAPLAAPSANAFGALSPTRAEHVQRSLGERVDVILDAGATAHGVESTILRLEPEPALLRPGALSVEEIEAVVGPVRRRVEGERSLSPGRLQHHYAPRTPLRVVHEAGVPFEARAKAGYLGFTQEAAGYAAVRVLSRTGDMREAAARLFEALHELDALGLDRIDAEPIEERGLGFAIADRLRRASSER